MERVVRREWARTCYTAPIPGGTTHQHDIERGRTVGCNGLKRSSTCPSTSGGSPAGEHPGGVALEPAAYRPAGVAKMYLAVRLARVAVHAGRRT
jgi:hypothetical protein